MKIKKTIALLSLFLLNHTCCLAQEWGIINVSVCNTRAEADYNAGMESQALLGMPVKVLDTDHEWTKIQTPEDYIHWTLSAAVKRVSRDDLSRWNQSPQVVVTCLYGHVYSQPSQKALPVSDVVAGDRLRYEGRKGRFYCVSYPDGRKGYLSRKEACPIDEWRARLDNSIPAILQTAKTLTGIPYMWGGTSPKGVDCSGLVRTTLYMHDIIIPRNASQQALTGMHIDIAPDFSNLKAGDLVFFGRKATAERPARVVHVGFYLGNKRFIHSLGWVHESSFDPASPDYDEYDTQRLLFACRVLPYINKEPKLFTTDQSEYYK